MAELQDILDQLAALDGQSQLRDLLVALVTATQGVQQEVATVKVDVATAKADIEVLKDAKDETPVDDGEIGGV